MKDGLALLATGLLAAGLAWLLFHYFGTEAWNVIALVTLVAVVADNIRLRRRLRELGAQPEGKRTWL